MDEHTLEILQYREVLRLAAGFAVSEAGKRQTAALAPTSDTEMVRQRLELLDEMVEQYAIGREPPLSGFAELREPLSRARAGATMTGSDFVPVVRTLLVCEQVRAWLWQSVEERCRRLRAFTNRIPAFRELRGEIERCLEPDGKVRDSASPELRSLRSRLRMLKARLEERIRQICTSPERRGCLQFPRPTLAGERPVLPVRAELKHLVPGIVHRASDTGRTLFIEPQEVVEEGNALSALRAEEEAEMRRILRRLAARLAQEADEVQEAGEALAHLDVLSAQARFSRQFNLTRPLLDEHRRLRLKQARHPLLEYLVKKAAGAEKPDQAPEEPAAKTAPKAHLAAELIAPRQPPAALPDKVVPLDARLGEEFSLLLITGPNTGGKTVALKTIGLACLLAQTGMYVPCAADSRFPVYDDIFADIGDEQSLEQSLSTFSAHMTRIGAILQRAGKDSLVLLDELGAGTDPRQGAALAEAVLERLLESGCAAVVTTHLGELKLFAYRTGGAENACVEFDPVSLRPTYKLTIGAPGESNAIAIARRIGVPAAVVARAEALLKQEDASVSHLIAEIQEVRQQATADRELATTARHQAEREQRQVDSLREDLESRLRAMKAGTYEDPRAIFPGDTVYVPRFEASGTVIRLSRDERRARVRLGGAEFEVSLDELRKGLPPKREPERLPPPPTPDAEQERKAAAQAHREAEHLKRKYEQLLREYQRRVELLPEQAGKPLEDGERVWSKSLEQVGTIKSIHWRRGIAVVNFGALSMELALGDLKRVTEEEESHARMHQSSGTTKIMPHRERASHSTRLQQRRPDQPRAKNSPETLRRDRQRVPGKVPSTRIREPEGPAARRSSPDERAARGTEHPEDMTPFVGAPAGEERRRPPPGDRDYREGRRPAVSREASEKPSDAPAADRPPVTEGRMCAVPPGTPQDKAAAGAERRPEPQPPANKNEDAAADE